MGRKLKPDRVGRYLRNKSYPNLHKGWKKYYTRKGKYNLHEFTRCRIESLPLNRAQSIADPTTGERIWAFGSDFKLSYLPASTEFTTLYDQYCISGIKVTFTFSHNSSELLNLNSTGMPQLHWCHDYDDATAPAGVEEMMQYPTYKTKRLDKPVSFFFKPSSLIMAYESAGTTAYKPAWKQFFDAADDVPHYGLHWLVKEPQIASNNGSIGIVQITYKYYLKMKNPR